MKKFLKIYLLLLIFLDTSGIFLLVYIVENYAAVLKYFAGEIGLEGKAKIITTKVNAIIKEDGVEQNRIKTFEDEGELYLVFEEIEDLSFGVLIVDKARKDIFAPVVANCYDLLFSKYLIQAECGQRGDYYSSEKHGGYQVRLESNDSQINFQLPECSYGKVVKSRKMEIIFIR